VYFFVETKGLTLEEVDDILEARTLGKRAWRSRRQSMQRSSELMELRRDEGNCMRKRAALRTESRDERILQALKLQIKRLGFKIDTIPHAY
jgi:hypothetical protein